MRHYIVPVSTNQGFKNFVPFEGNECRVFYYLLGTQKPGFVIRTAVAAAHSL
jgi:type I restriction enzyme S subunit